MKQESYQERLKRQAAESKAAKDAAEAVFWPKLAAALVARGHNVEWRDSNFLSGSAPSGKKIIGKIDDRRLENFSVRNDREKLRYGEQPSGKIKVVIGAYSERKQFFQSKTRNNDFDYEAIVNEIEARIAKAEARENRLTKEAENILQARLMRQRVVKDFFAEPGVTKEWSTGDYREEATEYLTTPKDSPISLKECESGGIAFSITTPIKKESDLRELMAACKKIGLCD